MKKLLLVLIAFIALFIIFGIMHYNNEKRRRENQFRPFSIELTLEAKEVLMDGADE